MFETIKAIFNNQELKDLYLEEIKQMNPNIEYKFLATNAISYLYCLLESISAAYTMGLKLKSEDFVEIENHCFNSLA